ncbi:MAG: hypothetical protein LC732_09200 [Acidobacteria bacterium]|nr:hypothetical protein [Acidobacteriota bacterium]
MLKKFGVLMAALTMVVALGACSVEQTEEGELPEVNVEGGNMPEYDVEPVDIDITTETATVTVPDIDVSTQTTTVTVPKVDVKPPQN